MKAVFISMDNYDGGRPVVVLVDDADQAQHVMFRALVEAGMLALHVSNRVVASTDPQSFFATRAEAIEAVQDWLGASEYIHCYDVVDKRSNTADSFDPACG